MLTSRKDIHLHLPLTSYSNDKYRGKCSGNLIIVCLMPRSKSISTAKRTAIITPHGERYVSRQIRERLNVSKPKVNYPICTYQVTDDLEESIG